MKTSRISNRRNGYGEEDYMHLDFVAEMQEKFLQKKYVKILLDMVTTRQENIDR